MPGQIKSSQFYLLPNITTTVTSNGHTDCTRQYSQFLDPPSEQRKTKQNKTKLSHGEKKEKKRKKSRKTTRGGIHFGTVDTIDVARTVIRTLTYRARNTDGTDIVLSSPYSW